MPYFYVQESEKDNLKGIKQDNQLYEAIDGTKLVKVYTTLPEDVPQLREKYNKTWEADILFPTRFQIDKIDSLEPTNPKIAFIDIETDNAGKVPNPETALEPVICVTSYTDDIYTAFVFRHDLSPGIQDQLFDGKLHETVYCRTEEELLNKLVNFIQQEEPDVISGWNSTRFDLPYLINRMRRLGISYDRLSPMNSVYTRKEYSEVVIKGVAIIDLYDAYRKFTQNLEESYQLDFIGKKVVGIGKTQSSSNIRWMWKYKLEELIEYNATDVLICAKIDSKLKLLDFLDELRRLCYCQLEDCLTTNRMADSYILRLFSGRKVFPTKTHHERHSYEGAFVGSWATGIYDNVVVFDLRSLYPNIICSLNLSPETIINEDEGNWGDNICVNNIYVRKDRKGFLPEVIEKLFGERAKYKELMNAEVIETDQWKLYYNRQYALKILLNAIYGQTAYPNSRVYHPKVAEATTYVGRKIINWSKDFLENIGYPVLYIDTDALYWSIGKDVDMEQIGLVLDLLNDSYTDFTKQFGVSGSGLEMEFEKVYRKAFFGKDVKKRYCGHCIWKLGQETDTLDVVGFEVRRSDSAQFSRKLQQNVFDMLLRQDKSKDEVMRYIGDEIDRIRKGDFKFTGIGIPKGISKDLDSYGYTEYMGKRIPPKDIIYAENRKGIPANIRGAIYTQENLGIELSSKPKLLYVSKVPNHLPDTDVICFDEDNQVPPGTEIDIEKMLVKLVKDKLESIFEALGWRMSELVYHWKGKPKKSGEQLELM